MNGPLILLAIVALLTALRDTTGDSRARTPAEMWHLARAYGWWLVPLSAWTIIRTAALVTGWSIAGLALLATRPAARILHGGASVLAGLGVILAAIAAHIRALYPPIPARQGAA